MPFILAASTAPTAELLAPLLWVFGVATIVVALLHRQKLPSLLGFLITGVLVGPAGFGVVEDAQAIEIMAEVGVVLLMFTIGLEISLKDLARMARQVLGGGALQIGATSILFAGLGLATGMSLAPAIAIGLLASASSTALVLRLLGDRGELGTKHGRLALAILLAQDFAVVGLMLVMPMLAEGDIAFGSLALGLGEGVLVTVGIYVGARFAFPWLLERVVALRSREVFLLATMAAVFGTAMIADSLGLSLALGSFVAGLVVSESDFSHQMFAEVLPFRDIFNGLFFASVGLLIDPDAVRENLALLGGLIAAIIIGKGVIVFVTAKALRLDTGAAFLAGVSLAQVGEFGLVLAQQGATLGLVTPTHHSLVIAAAVVTMGLTPLVLPWASNRRRRDKESSDELPELHGELNDHVIVVGYGLNGKNVARALVHLGVPVVVVEMNQSTVKQSADDPAQVVYGDATRPALLHHLQAESARALVSAIADAAATREIVANAHHTNPDMLIIARTRYVSEIEPLRELGADVVVPEEFETSLELVGKVMKAYGAPESAIQREKRALRDERYRLLLEDIDDSDTAGIGELLYALDVERISISEGSAAIGRTLGEIDFRAKSGATVVAVFRETQTFASPDATFDLLPADVLVVVGDAEAVGAARLLVAPHHETRTEA